MSSFPLRDFFLQLLLLLAGAILGLLGNILQGTGRKVLLGALALLFITTGSLWAGYEIGVRHAQSGQIIGGGATPQPSTATAAPLSCIDGTVVQLLERPWRLEGPGNGDAQAEQTIAGNALAGKDTVRITYDLHGTRFGVGQQRDESAIIFQQPNWHVINLANYGENGKDGSQTIYTPIAAFEGIADQASGTPGGTILNPNEEVIGLRARFWHQEPFTVDITEVAVCNGQ